MQKVLIFVSPPIFSLIQSSLIFGDFKPYFLLIFFIFLVLKGLFKKEFLLYFSFSESIFSHRPFYMFLIFWLILYVIMSLWKRRLFLAHKSFSFILIITFSFLTLVFWNLDSFFNLNLLKKTLFFSAFNIIFFLPFYLFLPKYLEKIGYEET